MDNEWRPSNGLSSNAEVIHLTSKEALSGNLEASRENEQWRLTSSVSLCKSNSRVKIVFARRHSLNDSHKSQWLAWLRD